MHLFLDPADQVHAVDVRQNPCPEIGSFRSIRRSVRFSRGDQILNYFMKFNYLMNLFTTRFPERYVAKFPFGPDRLLMRITTG
jgi:hypothetical protein